MTAPPKSRWRKPAWLLAGALVVGASFLLDARLVPAVSVLQNPDVRAFAKLCSKLGEGWVIAAGGILLSTLCFFLRRPQAAAKIFYAASASLLIGLAATVLRVIFGRARPLNHDVPPGFYGMWHDGQWIVGQFKFSAFPSGHAATAAGLVATVWLVHRGWALALLPYALLVMWSRMALECHHLSDVLASTLLALLLAGSLKKILLPTVEFQFGNLQRKWWRK